MVPFVWRMPFCELQQHVMRQNGWLSTESRQLSTLHALKIRAKVPLAVLFVYGAHRQSRARSDGTRWLCWNRRGEEVMRDLTSCEEIGSRPVSGGGLAKGDRS